MKIDEAVDKILGGNCILFTGAGFSRNAINIKDEALKAASQLTKYLYEKCNIGESDDDLAAASDIYLDTFGETSLIRLLNEEYTPHPAIPEFSCPAHGVLSPDRL